MWGGGARIFSAGLPKEKYIGKSLAYMYHTAIGRLSSCEILKWPPLIIIGYATYAPLSGVYECPLCSHGPEGPVGV